MGDSYEHQVGPGLHASLLRGPGFAMALLWALEARVCNNTTRQWHADFIPDQQHHWKQRLELGHLGSATHCLPLLPTVIFQRVLEEGCCLVAAPVK